jgi:hypothetical protein
MPEPRLKSIPHREYRGKAEMGFETLLSLLSGLCGEHEVLAGTSRFLIAKNDLVGAEFLVEFGEGFTFDLADAFAG